jgi:hypothetical protein
MRNYVSFDFVSRYGSTLFHLCRVAETLTETFAELAGVGFTGLSCHALTSLSAACIPACPASIAPSCSSLQSYHHFGGYLQFDGRREPSSTLFYHKTCPTTGIRHQDQRCHANKGMRLHDVITPRPIRLSGQSESQLYEINMWTCHVLASPAQAAKACPDPSRPQSAT